MIYNIFFGFLLGFLIEIKFRFFNRKYKGPSSNQMKKYIYKYKNKCYKFDTDITICSSKIL